MIKFRPIGDKILVKPIEKAYQGLIVIPMTAKKDPPMMAEVLAVGPGMLTRSGDRWPMPCVPGDMILFEKNQGTDIKIDGAMLRVIRDDHVLALIVPDSESN